MAHLEITDTGKYNARDASAPSGEVKANNGSAFSIKTAKITLDLAQKINDNPVMNKTKDDTSTNEYDWTEVDVNGIEFPKWKVDCVFDFSNATDRSNFTYLLKCCITKGIKKIDAGSTDAKSTPMIKYSLYAIEKSVTYIYGRMKLTHCEQDAKSGLVKVSITIIESGGLSTSLT